MGLYDAVGYQPNGTNPIAVLPSQIDEVDGEAGARALTMAPNSGKLALDGKAAFYAKAKELGIDPEYVLGLLK